ncbi:MAG: UvrD-helicase domain-containing protein [Clostridia bacterium]|nr:UvrD-helicase domain-containing protein [Clostridia bacterium]
MPQWTEAQQQAIDARNNETLVSAAAGSGKTAVLIEHVLQLLREGGKVDRLLIITFTRAAAAELRDRLVAALDQEAGQNKHLRRQMLAVRHAHISTLHVFCHHILRMHFQAADIDPMAKIGETTMLEPLLTRAVDESMEEVCQSEDADDIALVEQYGDAQIVDMARELYSFLRAQADPHGWIEEKLSDPAGEGLEPFLLLLRKEAMMSLEGADQLCRQALSLTERPGGPDYLATTLENDRALIDALTQALRAGQIPTGDIKFSARARAPKGGEYDAVLTDRCVNLRENMKDLVKEALSLLPDDLEEARSEVAYTLPALRALVRMVWNIDAKYAKYKEERNLLDYGDLEHLALKALEEKHVRDSVASGFDAIFVDEYQDVSAIQEAIVRRIHNEKNRLFMVGDVKQSIYRFRLADPTLFLTKYDHFSEDPAAKGRRILLSSNFRSRGNILAATNCVFERAMRRGATEIDYDEAAHLRAGAPSTGDPPVELHIISDEVEQSTEEAGESRKGWMYEAQLAAQRIKSLVGTPIRDKEGQRALRFRDCVILLRSASGHAPQIAKILADAGVPAYSDADAQYFELPEVRDMMNVLRVIDNPYQDIPLLSALRCPCFAFSSERLARIRLTDGTRQKPFWQIFYPLRETDADVRHFCEKIEQWRFWSQHLHTDQLIYKILRDTGLYARAGAQRDGGVRQANLRLLAERAQGEGVRFSLHTFLVTSDVARRINDAGTAKEMSENEDVARIMTLHKSKGLEFPVVILMELARHFRMPGDGEILRCDAEQGLALKRCDVEQRITGHTAAGRALEYKRRREIRAEEARLLYVDMTRAREQLILLASPRNLENDRLAWSLPEGDYAAGQASCMLDWIGQAVNPGLQSGQDTAYIAPNGSQWDLQWHNGADFKQHLPPEASFVIPDGLGKVDKDFLSTPPERRHRVLKISVTSLLRGGILGDDEEETIESKRRELHLDTLPQEVPNFMLEKKPGAADRGTATHKALCALDMERPIAPQLDTMVSQGAMTQEERRLIRESDIDRFYRSSLGLRVRAASTVKREWSFCIMEGDLLVQGVLDLCFQEDGAWVLVDYKTDRCPAEELPGMYGDQLRWYARALRDITKAPVKELWLYSLREGKAVEVEETPMEIANTNPN